MTYISNRIMEKLNSNMEDIIVRHLLGEASSDEESLLLSWLKDDMENQKYFFQMKEIWNTSHLNEEDIKTDASWNSLKLAAKGKITQLPAKTDKSYIKLFRYAAIFIAVIAVGALTFRYGSLIFNTTEPLSLTEIRTQNGQKKEVILPDGTKIWINSGSSFKYSSNYGESNREVFLEGEAFFEVTRDTAKTFIVHADNITIKVLGTSFNVRCYPELKSIETTVISGTVSLENNETSESSEVVILNKKEKATFLRNQQKMYITKNSDIISKETVDPISLNKITLNQEEADYIASWKDQNLSFNNESFEEIAFKLERWFNVKITIKDEKLKSHRYKGKFDNVKSVFEVLKVVKLTTPMTYEYNEKTKEITIKEQKE